jgi:hypothetical protein
MSRPHPDDVDAVWCPDCGSELSFAGVQPAGIGQFFCETCRYRHDRYVGRADVEA